MDSDWEGAFEVGRHVEGAAHDGTNPPSVDDAPDSPPPPASPASRHERDWKYGTSGSISSCVRAAFASDPRSERKRRLTRARLYGIGVRKSKVASQPCRHAFLDGKDNLSLNRHRARNWPPMRAGAEPDRMRSAIRENKKPAKIATRDNTGLLHSTKSPRPPTPHCRIIACREEKVDIGAPRH